MKRKNVTRRKSGPTASQPGPRTQVDTQDGRYRTAEKESKNAIKMKISGVDEARKNPSPPPITLIQYIIPSS